MTPTADQSSSLAQVAVDTKGNLVAVNQQATALFGLIPDDVYRPFTELEASQLLNNCVVLDTFYRERPSLTLINIKWQAAKGTTYFDIMIMPIFNPKKALLAFNLTFINVSALRLSAQEDSLTKVSM